MTLTPEQLAARIKELQSKAPVLAYDVPDEVYFALPAMSATVLKSGRQAVACMRHTMLNPKEATDAMGLGSLVDTLVLEPAKLNERFLIVPEIPKRNSNAGKAEYATMESESAGRTIVDKAEYEAALVMRGMLYKHPAASKWLAHAGHAQAVVVWWEPVEGFPDMLCKAKLDRFIPGVLALDLKTARSAAPWKFSRQASDLGYGMQAGWYDHGFSKVTGETGDRPFGLVVVENVAPHLVATYSIKPDDLNTGFNTCKRLLGQFAAAQASGVWPGYSDDVEELELHGWGLRCEGAMPGGAADDGDDGFI